MIEEVREALAELKDQKYEIPRWRNRRGINYLLDAAPAEDLSPHCQWSADLVNFHDDGLTNGAGTTTIGSSRGAPSGGLVSVTGGVAPDKIFVRVEVTQK